MFGDIDDPRVAVALGEVFGAAAASIRGRSVRSAERQAEGLLPTSEPSLTDVLVDDLYTVLKTRLASAQDDLRASGVSATIELSVNRPPHEHKHGADVGIRISIATDNYTMTKASLVQCKRMYGTGDAGTFDEIEGRGEEQAQKMLRITPASFFMLYHPLSQIEALQMAGVPVALTCPVEPEAMANRHDDDLSDCAFWHRADQIWDFGIAMVPAARVLAMSAAAAKADRKISCSAKDVFRGAWPFGVFIVDLFGSCLVGDPREEVVRLVSTKAQRADAVARSGVQDPDPFEGFAVRNILQLDLSRAKAR